MPSFGNTNPQVTWVFVTLPIEAADELRFMTRSLPKVGFGTIKVRVTLGSDQWLTSVFPDKSCGSYLLPVKAQIRKNQGLLVEIAVPWCYSQSVSDLH